MTISQQGIDQVHVHGVRDHRKRERIRREFLSTAPPNLFDNARELVKTSFETDLYYATCEAYLRFFDEFDLPRRWLPPLSRVHIFTAHEYHGSIDHDSGGTAMDTHMYLIRHTHAQRRIKMAHDMTHELAHLVSRNEIRVCVSGRIRNIRHSRSGVKYKRSKRFDGLNEGTTEWIARFVRWRLIRHSSPLMTPQEKRVLRRTVVYPIHVRLVEELCMFVARKRRIQRPYDVLFHDYLLGSSNFMDSLESVLAGSTRILMRVDVTSQSALNALRALGFRKAEKEMARYIDADEQM